MHAVRVATAPSASDILACRDIIHVGMFSSRKYYILSRKLLIMRKFSVVIDILSTYNLLYVRNVQTTVGKLQPSALSLSFIHSFISLLQQMPKRIRCYK